MWKRGKELPFLIDMDLKGPVEERESANLRWGPGASKCPQVTLCDKTQSACCRTHPRDMERPQAIP